MNSIRAIKKIRNFLSFINVNNGKTRLIKEIYQDIFYNDEPKIYSFTARLENTTKITNGFSVQEFTGGCSFSKEKAILKTIGEALERHGLSIYKEEKFIWESYDNLQERKLNPIDPQNFISFSIKDFREKPNFNFYLNKKTKFNWIKGHSLTQKGEVLIPAQLVFVPYRYKKEPVIRFPITTGAACYTSFKRAILKGLLEIIERDSFIINYLNKLSRNIINIAESEEEIFKKITSSVKRYNLKLYILDISTDVPVYSILAIIIDKTGLGPAVSLGIKSDLDIKSAIIGAIEESFAGRFWIRDTMVKQGSEKIEEIKRRKNLIFDLKERGLLWSEPQMINKIKFFLKGKKIPIKNFPDKKTLNLNTLLKYFKKQNIEVLYINITPPYLKRKQIFVVKVFIPKFQPLYLDEKFPYWQGERLKSIPKKLGVRPLKEFNKFPHPFL